MVRPRARVGARARVRLRMVRPWRCLSLRFCHGQRGRAHGGCRAGRTEGSSHGRSRGGGARWAMVGAVDGQDGHPPRLDAPLGEAAGGVMVGLGMCLHICIASRCSGGLGRETASRAARAADSLSTSLARHDRHPHWHPPIRRHAPQPRPPAVQAAARARVVRGPRVGPRPPARAQGRPVRGAPVEPAPRQAADGRQPQGKAPRDRQDGRAPHQALHPARRRRPPRHRPPRPDHLRLPQHQDEPGPLLAAGAARRPHFPPPPLRLADPRRTTTSPSCPSSASTRSPPPCAPTSGPLTASSPSPPPSRATMPSASCASSASCTSSRGRRPTPAGSS